jgi:hypothetical protein
MIRRLLLQAFLTESSVVLTFASFPDGKLSSAYEASFPDGKLSSAYEASFPDGKLSSAYEASFPDGKLLERSISWV